MSAYIMGAIILMTLHANWGNHKFAAMWAGFAFLGLALLAFGIES